MITKTPRLDLRRNHRESDRAAIGEMYAVPDGRRVLIDVGDRLADWETAQHLSGWITTHHLELVGTLRATDSWEDALLGRGVFA